MSRSILAALLAGVLFVAACAPMIPASETPKALKDVYADGILAYAAENDCRSIEVNERRLDRRYDDVIVRLIEAGYTYDQIDAMINGLDFEDEWFFPYVVRLERKYNIDVDDVDEFCRAMRAERRAGTTLGRMMS